VIAGTKVTIPVTFGERAETAIANIEKAGLKVTTKPARDPKKTYVSQGSSPEGGQKVSKGSHVVLNVRTGK
jgi:beta-lactam-binding protein with PASTA domain